MRISLLMQREPFGEILTRTLESFWQRQHGEEFSAKWLWKPNSSPPNGSVDFLCNVYLNALFPAGTNNGSLDPIRREFSRSLVAWRVPLQRAYCKLALSPAFAGLFKQAVLRVSPVHETLSRQVVIPGNNKLRILDRQESSAYGVLKHGFSAERFANEVTSRRQAEQFGIPVPKLHESDEGAGWFREEYVIGTPLNRIADRQVVASATRQAQQSLKTLTENTSTTVSSTEYADRLALRVGANCEKNRLLSMGQRETICEVIDSLANEVHRAIETSSASLDEIVVAQTHGDFQPANILIAGSKLWIIDWEYAAQRQRVYDLLVLHNGVRNGGGLVARLQTFIARGLPGASDAELIESYPELATAESRRFVATILLMEELDLRMSENTNRHFSILDEGLSVLLQELAQWPEPRWGCS